MLQRTASIGMVAWITLAAGCSTHRVQADGVGRLVQPMPVLVKADTVLKPSITVWSLLWGVAELPDEVSLACGNRGLKDVAVKSNVGYTLLTLITLGLVAPRRVEAYCVTPDPEPGPLAPPGGGP
jgi:hypothetical protein